MLSRPLSDDERELVEQSLDIVIVTVRAVRHHARQTDDLISEGALGLMEAAAAFDPLRAGWRTFAITIVRRRMRDWLDRDHTTCVQSELLASIPARRDDGPRRIDLRDTLKCIQAKTHARDWMIFEASADRTRKDAAALCGMAELTFSEALRVARRHARLRAG